MPDIVINGAEGRIEGRFHVSRVERAPIALLLHPHPQHGGSMHNKVVFALHQVFAQLGFSTLRFNFRGVGRSQGSYSRGEGELTDAASALDWLQSTCPNAASCWVAARRSSTTRRTTPSAASCGITTRRNGSARM